MFSALLRASSSELGIMKNTPAPRATTTRAMMAIVPKPNPEDLDFASRLVPTWGSFFEDPNHPDDSAALGVSDFLARALLIPNPAAPIPATAPSPRPTLPRVDSGIESHDSLDFPLPV